MISVLYAEARKRAFLFDPPSPKQSALILPAPNKAHCVAKLGMPLFCKTGYMLGLSRENGKKNGNCVKISALLQAGVVSDVHGSMTARALGLKTESRRKANLQSLNPKPYIVITEQARDIAGCRRICEPGRKLVLCGFLAEMGMRIHRSGLGNQLCISNPAYG